MGLPAFLSEACGTSLGTRHGVVGLGEGGRGTDLAHLGNSQAGCVGEAVLHRRRQGLGARE